MSFRCGVTTSFWCYIEVFLGVIRGVYKVSFRCYNTSFLVITLPL
nr:MAG TPA: hypothetical protein [Caudoviricetes sp.]